MKHRSPVPVTTNSLSFPPWNCLLVGSVEDQQINEYLPSVGAGYPDNPFLTGVSLNPSASKGGSPSAFMSSFPREITRMVSPVLTPIPVFTNQPTSMPLGVPTRDGETNLNGPESDARIYFNSLQSIPSIMILKSMETLTEISPC